MQEILITTTNKSKVWRTMYEEELQYHLDCIAQDPVAAKEYEQWKLSVGADDHPEEVISKDIQEINRQLIDLIAQIQNAEPAPHRKTLEDGYYKNKGVLYSSQVSLKINKMAVDVADEVYEMLTK